MRILHVFRTPVGGLFRHVRDLARGQSETGHAVGLICDSTSGGETAERLLSQASPNLALGIARIPISRLPGIGDLAGIRQVAQAIAALKPDVVHCHGAKGGLYGRVAARLAGVVSVYTPHGGSLHYSWSTPSGAAFLGTESLLRRVGSGLVFVCRYEREAFDRKIGLGRTPNAVVHNGLWPEEFATIARADDAADLLFIGDMRRLKGVDLLIAAIAALNQTRRTTACLVGDGPDLEQFQKQVQSLDLDGLVSFPGRMPASEAFRRGRLLVMPSRAESFPYVVLEACAAGLPMLASDVGGIGEVLPPDLLVPADDLAALTAAIAAALADPDATARRAAAVRGRIARDFSAASMAQEVTSFYRRLEGSGAGAAAAALTAQ